MTSPSPSTFMELALTLGAEAALAGEVPVGCVLVRQGKILATSRNEVMALQDVTAHAEVLALRRAAQVLGSRILEGCDLYVTLEPCPLCAQALSFARLGRIYYGAPDPKGGGIDHGPRIFTHALHKPEVYGGIMEQAASAQLREFFKALRNQKVPCPGS